MLPSSENIHPPSEFPGNGPPCSQKDANFSSQGLSKTKAKMIRVEYLSLENLFLLRKGKEGSICQQPDAAAGNSGKSQRRAASNQRLHGPRKGGVLERWSWKLYIDVTTIYFACLSTDNRGDRHTAPGSHCPCGEANQKPPLFNTIKDFSGSIRAK